MAFSTRRDRRSRGEGLLASRYAKLRRPPAPFVWFTNEMLESPAFRALSITARRILDRLCWEHVAHGGVENGRLKCTYANFIQFGASREQIPAALRELEAFGWIRYQRGGRWGETKQPNLYKLTWLPIEIAPATNEWKSVTSTMVKEYKSDIRERRKARARSRGKEK